MTTPPRISIITKVIPPLTSRKKKYLHAAVMAAVSGGLTFLAFSLDSVITLPRGAKGALVGILVAAISKVAGAILADLPTQDKP
jgi:hypothetical protein